MKRLFVTTKNVRRIKRKSKIIVYLTAVYPASTLDIM